MPMDFTAFVQFIDSWHLPWVITDTFKFIIAFPIIFHTLNGIRFMVGIDTSCWVWIMAEANSIQGFDMAKGTDIKTVYKTGWTVLALSTLLSLLIVLESKRNKKSRPVAGKSSK